MKTKLRLIADAYERLDVLNNQKMTAYRDRLLKDCIAEEKDHRGWGADFKRYHTSNTVSVQTAAKMFAVKRIAEYLTGSTPPTIRQYLSLQRSCFFAAALVEEYRNEITAAWAALDVKAIASLDYCEFVKVKEEAS